MKKNDGQIHVWLPNTPDRPWPEGAVSVHGDPYSAEMAIAQMDRSGVSGAVLTPPGWMDCDNSHVTEAAEKYPDRFVVMGKFDYEASNAPRELDRWRDLPYMVGLRFSWADPRAVPILLDGNHWFWSRCTDNNFPLMCSIPRHLPALGPIARRYPKIRFIVDHGGRYVNGPKNDEAWEDIDILLELAKIPNVALKVSSLPSFSTQPFPFPNLHRPIRQFYDHFGSERLIWGSDVTRLTSTYDENIRLFSEALDFLSEDDKENIFWRSLSRWCDVKL